MNYELQIISINCEKQWSGLTYDLQSAIRNS